MADDKGRLSARIARAAVARQAYRRRSNPNGLTAAASSVDEKTHGL